MSRMSLIQGDIMHIPLDDKSVQCCICSPPYWGLRSYHTGDQKEFELGGEKLHDCLGWATGNSCGCCYICHVRMYAQEIHRVLRDDGVWFLNLGDSYNGSGGAGGDYNPGGLREGQPRYKGRNVATLKAKDLSGIPWRAALALQADGWWIRNDIIWYKNNAMPENVTDRCARDHEYIFLLSKSRYYYFDHYAIKEPLSRVWGDNNIGKDNQIVSGSMDGFVLGRKNDPHGGLVHTKPDSSGRNKRTVWTMSTSGYSGSHFAPFPPELPETCIKAGTSEYGCCPECGTPWNRVVERTFEGEYNDSEAQKQRERMEGVISGGVERVTLGRTENVRTETIGWEPGCKCGIDSTAPCTVLDPFSGVSTTIMVANQLGRRGIGLELSSKYIDLSRDRLQIKALEEWENGVDGTQTELSDLPMFSNL